MLVDHWSAAKRKVSNNLEGDHKDETHVTL